jgi:hypothetical protein
LSASLECNVAANAKSFRFLWHSDLSLHKDHAPPHFHAIYGEHDAAIEIETGKVLKGTFPRRAAKMVKEWAAQHREELLRNWDLARAESALNRIDPLS